MCYYMASYFIRDNFDFRPLFYEDIIWFVLLILIM